MSWTTDESGIDSGQGTHSVALHHGVYIGFGTDPAYLMSTGGKAAGA
jgi:hypothetical protein